MDSTDNNMCQNKPQEKQNISRELKEVIACYLSFCCFLVYIKLKKKLYIGSLMKYSVAVKERKKKKLTCNHHTRSREGLGEVYKELLKYY